MRKRVVLDTNQIVSAGVRWMDPMYHHDGNEAVELIKIVFANHNGLASSKILAEYLEKLVDKGVKHELATELIKRLWGAFEIIKTTTTSCNPAPTDPDDLIFMLCAIDGSADLLVSNDDHLLALKEHYDPPVILERKDALMVLST